MKKKLMSLLLALIMLVTLVSPITVSAAETRPTYTVLVLDTSGTHTFFYNKNPIYTADSALSAVLKSASAFAKGILNLSNNYVAVVSCRKEAEVISPFSQDSASIIQEINAIPEESVEYINLNAGIQEAQKLLDAVIDYMPAPTDIESIKGVNPDTEEEETKATKKRYCICNAHASLIPFCISNRSFSQS